jgi:hypothetical protein
MDNTRLIKGTEKKVHGCIPEQPFAEAKCDISWMLKNF